MIGKNRYTDRFLRKIRSAVFNMAILMIGLTGCSLPSGTPPVLTVGEIDITLGKSIPYDLTDSSDFTFDPPWGRANYILYFEGKSYSWDYLTVYNGEEKYAYLYIYNPESVTRLSINCPIYKVTFSMHTEEKSWAENNVLVNGINFYGMNSDEVKAVMQEFELSKETDTGNLWYEDGDYEYLITFDETTGLVDEVTVEKDIRTELSY